MRPTRVTELPTHRGHSRKPATTKKLQSAFEKGLGLAGLAPTKAGSGDKERAYIVRQNSLLKWVLAILFIVFVMSAVAFTTILEIKIAKRASIKTEVKHHEEFHEAQVKLMHVHLSLQQALKDEVHETMRVEEYKAFLEKSLGDHFNQLEDTLRKSGVTSEVIEKIKRANEQLRMREVAKITALIHRFQSSATQAREALKRIAKEIVADVDTDEKEKQEHKKTMKDLGTSVDDYDYNIEDDYDEEVVEKELENFFKILQTHKFPDISREKLAKWELFLNRASQTLENDGKETDLDIIKKKVEKLVAESAVKLDPFDKHKHGSIIDYFEMIVEEAKIAPFKQELLDLYAGWKSDKGNVSPYTVLSGVERIAEDNGLYLLLEWLEGNDPEDQDDEEYYDEDTKEDDSDKANFNQALNAMKDSKLEKAPPAEEKPVVKGNLPPVDDKPHDPKILEKVNKFKEEYHDKVVKDIHHTSQ